MREVGDRTPDLFFIELCITRPRWEGQDADDVPTVTIGRRWFVSASVIAGPGQRLQIWEPSVCGEGWSIFLLPVEGLFVTNSRLYHEQALGFSTAIQRPYARAAFPSQHRSYPCTGMVVNVPIRLLRQHPAPVPGCQTPILDTFFTVPLRDHHGSGRPIGIARNSADPCQDSNRHPHTARTLGSHPISRPPPWTLSADEAKSLSLSPSVPSRFASSDAGGKVAVATLSA